MDDQGWINCYGKVMQADPDSANVNQFLRWLCIEITGGILEVVILATSVHIVCSLQMPWSKKFGVSMIFACRIMFVRTMFKRDIVLIF